MTTAADDRAVEEAFEAYLAGRPVPEQGAGLAAFADAVRSSTSRPGRPNAALADLLATGLLTDQPSPSRATAPRTRRRITMFFPALLAKIASAGAVAQVATGAGIALVAFTGAGTAGVLPDPLQHGFATVAETVGITGVDDPREESTREDRTSVQDPALTEGTGTTTGTEATTALDGGTGDVAETPVAPPTTPEQWAEEGPRPDQSFGDWVSYGATRGWATGEAVREHARNKGERVPEEYAETPVETPEETVTEPQPETAESSTPDTGRGNGNGNAGGNGNGGGNGGGNGNGRGNR
ncbi:hypothetical protein ACI8AF_02160 [Blastococcus sp. SYSU D00669]